MKIRFELDNDLLLGKTFNILVMIIVAASGLENNGKHYVHFFLHEWRISYRNAAIRKR